MDVTTTRGAGRNRRLGSIATVLAAALSVALAAPSLAQESSPSPPAETVSEGSSEGIAFPIMLGGQVLETDTISGPELLARFSEGDMLDPVFVEATEAFVAGVGKTIDDLTVKTALATPSEGNHVAVTAFRIEGVDGLEFVEDAVGLLFGDIETPELLLRTLGLKWVLRVTDAEMPGVYPRTVYVRDDTVWVVEGDEEYVWDALDQLPDPTPVGVSPIDSLISETPVALADRRRTGLYEATEPFFMPTMEQHLGPGIEDWLRDLYVEAGVSPAEMLGVWALWGIESVQDSIQIEGYRLPAGAEDMVERLRAEIFLGGGPDAAGDVDILAGIEQTEQEIAGRAVTTLDYEPVSQHIFLSAAGDTVWVVTDVAGESELVEEALTVLP